MTADRERELGEVAAEAVEKGFIDRFVADYCRPHGTVMAERLAAFAARRTRGMLGGGDFALAAGPTAPAREVEAPDETVRFSFSSGDRDAPNFWCAELVVPPKAGPATMLELTVRTSGGPAAAGAFRLAGVSLPLADGKAQLPFGAFIAGIKDAEVAYVPEGGAPISGTLAFFG